MDVDSFYMCASWEDGCGFFLRRDDAGDIRDSDERTFLLNLGQRSHGAMEVWMHQSDLSKSVTAST